MFFFEGLARHGSIGRIDAEVGIPNRICTHEQNLCHHRFARRDARCFAVSDVAICTLFIGRVSRVESSPQKSCFFVQTFTGKF